MQRFFSLLAEAVPASRAPSTSSPATGSWRSSAPRSPTRTTPGAPVTRPCRCSTTSPSTRPSCGAAKGLNFSTRIGINSGEVVAGAIGGGGDCAYTAIGHTVGLAQRMEALAEPGKAYLTESTAELARGYLDLDDLGEFEIKGASRPVAGLRAGRRRPGALAPRPRPRARLLALRRPRGARWRRWRRRWSGRSGGEATAVGVVAEPGIGKSRLYHEFAQRCRSEGHRGLRGAGPGARQVDPLHADPADAALLLRDRRQRPRAAGAGEDRRPARCCSTPPSPTTCR